MPFRSARPFSVKYFVAPPARNLSLPFALPPGQNAPLRPPELLHHVFNSMAIHGRIMMGQLPFVLTGAEVQATAEEVQEQGLT